MRSSDIAKLRALEPGGGTVPYWYAVDADVDDALKVPAELRLSDGRTVDLTLWEPYVKFDDIVRVKIEGIIRRPKPEATP